MTSARAASDLALLVVALAAGVFDLRTGRIPNLLTYPAILAGFLLGILQGPPGFLSAFVGFLVGFAVFAVAFNAGMMGGGDVKLIGAIGALKGFPFVVWVMYYACAVTAVAALAIVTYKGAAIDTLRDVGRTLVSGFTGRGWRLPEPRTSLKLPFGAALCVASQVALLAEIQGWVR